MSRLSRSNLYDILSLGMLLFITIISIARFNYLPQFVDGYYHLSCANGYIKSGGWVGIDWWNFAPLGRPHLYPPFYHLIIVFLKTIGLNGLDALRLTEVLISPLFFFILWFVFRREASSIFSFFLLFISSGFFSFYSSVSGNFPASFAIICGVLSWFFLKSKRVISAILLLTLSLYTHAGIPYIFITSFLILAIFHKGWRLASLKIVFASFVLSSPLIFHQLKYVHYLNFPILREAKFTHFNIFVLAFGFTSLLFNFRKKDFLHLLFSGYLVGSIIVFLRYPYRLFSAQGILGLVFYASLLLEDIFKNLALKKIKVIFLLLVTYLLFFHSTLDLEEGRFNFHFLNSTFYNIGSGKFLETLEFTSLFYPQRYLPILKIVNEHTRPDDIITSNLRVSSQIFSALSDRPSSHSMLGEVRQFRDVSPYSFAKIIIWIKPVFPYLESLRNRFNLINIYESDIALIFLNPLYSITFVPIKSKLNFVFITILSLFFLFIFVVDNAKILWCISKMYLRRKDNE